MGYVQGSDNGRRNKQSTTSGLHNTHEGGVLHEVGLDQSGYESSHGTEYHVRSIPGARGKSSHPTSRGNSNGLGSITRRAGV